ncbi:fungal hydrophobin [Imleria badia]|nr:fungal hydrophobin [Imleria badia]
MFTRVFALLPLALLASASHLEARQSCSSENQYCCNSVQTVSQVEQILPGISTVLGAVTANVPLGLVCSPLTVIGVAGNSCNQQTVCCENNNFNGLVNVGCTPINVSA